jgi:biopolymer transport protein ExbD
MPRVKPKRSNPVIDMTAMCDVSFLLLTFFILTAKFKPQAVVAVDVPSARSTTLVENALIITVNKDGEAYVSMKEKAIRYAMLEQMVEQYGERYPALQNLTKNQKEFFSLVDTWGTPVEQTPQVLSMDGNQFKEYQEDQMKGIPYDSINNQLGDWVMAARYAASAANSEIKIGIKGDQNANVDHIRKVIKSLTSKDINRLILITTLSGPGTEEPTTTTAAPTEGN